MPDSTVLDRTTGSTGYGIASSARNLPTGAQHRLDYQPELRRPSHESTFTGEHIGRLFNEELDSVFRGTYASGSSLWNSFSRSLLLELLNTGFEHGTQYAIRVEPVNPFTSLGSLTPTTQLNPQQATDLTQRALALSSLTQEQLATAMGVSRQSVQNWLKGKGGISPDNQERLSELVALFQQAMTRLGNSRHVSHWLLTPWREDGPSPLDLLADSRIGAVRGQLLRSRAVPQSTVEPVLQASGRVSRRAVSAGYSPPWARPSRPRNIDPEEGIDFEPEEAWPEPYRDTNSSRVTGLALA